MCLHQHLSQLYMLIVLFEDAVVTQMTSCTLVLGASERLTVGNI
jgi:hypothetical protein